ncbi:phospholipid phosphatase 1-like isoform X2 [Mercenaria mercenaria]|uniref:phospholipid phosphatase 1-like isoform X2 n=1 Tax=Mercenaria mercenaria TaxID=6596 RepID=UPI00234EBA38|nr:phospholipid phosphatase 1-like isoform X2 [Mercenaria mercenaria]
METMPKGTIWLRHLIIAQISVDVFIWFAVAVPVLFLFLHGTPYDRGFFCDDATLSFPYKQDKLSTSLLLVAGVIVSVLVIVITEVLNSIDIKCRRQCLSSDVIVHCVKNYAIFLAGFILQQFVVEVVKSKMGVLRPNFFDVCKPQFNMSVCPGYITNYTCTGDDTKEIRDSRLSFPSGHSSLSMYIAVYFCMYIEDRLKISFSRILKLFLQAALIFIAILCGVDRIIDNKHHPSDVVSGFLLGVVVAVFVYYKVGKSVLISPCATAEMQISNKSCDCCTCGQTPEVEPQTPMPLLQNEDLNGFGCQSSTEVKTHILLDTPFKARRHLSTPITPTYKTEDVV